MPHRILNYFTLVISFFKNIKISSNICYLDWLKPIQNSHNFINNNASNLNELTCVIEIAIALPIFMLHIYFNYLQMAMVNGFCFSINSTFWLIIDKFMVVLVLKYCNNGEYKFTTSKYNAVLYCK